MNDYIKMIESSLLNYISLKKSKVSSHEINFNFSSDFVCEKRDMSLSMENFLNNDLIESIRYSLLAKGKRIRPIILLEFCRACGGDVNTAMPFACAIEMIHAYSLIHDDLPCMDDDDMRRGKPSNHIVYGEDVALLAGDSLLTLAFEVMLADESLRVLPADRVAKAAGLLAKYAGVRGMISGQFIDMQNEDKEVNVDILREMDLKKTGALICAAAEMGCVLAGADEIKIDAAQKYAESLGLAFQIVDDILDQTSTTEKLGKPVGSDTANKKSTYVSLLGLDECRLLAKKLTSDAILALDQFEGDTNYLKSLALKLSNRDS